MRLVATAGHVDHGKSTLVHALTGIDPDRLAEERRRGLTIDLGFAWCALPSGEQLAIVDVPGHVRFLPNLLAGVGAVEAALFVVAAREGWMAQSEEHLRILELVGVGAAVVAVTGVAGTEPARVDAVRSAVNERFSRSGLAGSPVLAVDAPAGFGVGEVLQAFGELFARRPPLPDRGRPRLWVDRSFTIRGAGTVVTGTLAGGALEPGAEVAVVAGERARRPSAGAWARPCSVRAIQALGAEVPLALAGSRAALNLRQVGHRELGRGDAVVLPGQWHRCSRFDASLVVVPDHPEPVTRRGAYLLYLGSGEHAVRLEVVGEHRVAPGSEGHVRLTLPCELPLEPGDRFVLREAGRGLTVGGGEVLDVDPVLPLSRARPDRSVERVVRERGWVGADELERLTGERSQPTVGSWVCDPAALARTVATVRSRVAKAGPLGLDVAVLDERERAAVGVAGELAVVDARVRRHDAPDPLADHAWLVELRRAPFAPPPPTGVAPEEVAALVRRGSVVEAAGTYFAAAAVEDLTAVVVRHLEAEPRGLTLGALRDLAGTSRRFAVALGELLDRRGITVRRGAVRLAGPALERASAQLNAAGTRPERTDDGSGVTAGS